MRPHPPLALTQVLAERHANAGVRAAGLWLHGHPLDKSDFIVAGVKKLETFVFYAKGQDPQAQNLVLTLTSGQSLEEVAGLLRAGRADLLLLDQHYVQSYPALARLWNDPDLAAGLGLRPLHLDRGQGFMLFLPVGVAAK
jgi:hypothetical protein